MHRIAEGSAKRARVGAVALHRRHALSTSEPDRARGVLPDGPSQFRCGAGRVGALINVRVRRPVEHFSQLSRPSPEDRFQVERAVGPIVAGGVLRRKRVQRHGARNEVRLGAVSGHGFEPCRRTAGNQRAFSPWACGSSASQGLKPRLSNLFRHGSKPCPDTSNGRTPVGVRSPATRAPGL